MDRRERNRERVRRDRETLSKRLFKEAGTIYIEIVEKALNEYGFPKKDWKHIERKAFMKQSEAKFIEVFSFKGRLLFTAGLEIKNGVICPFINWCDRNQPVEEETPSLVGEDAQVVDISYRRELQ